MSFRLEDLASDIGEKDNLKDLEDVIFSPKGERRSKRSPNVRKPVDLYDATDLQDSHL